jgi:peroxin-2
MSLERAWLAAQSTLADVRTSFAGQPLPEQRVFRVGQLDAELLDHELASVLKEPLTKTLAIFKVRFRISPSRISARLIGTC